MTNFGKYLIGFFFLIIEIYESKNVSDVQKMALVSHILNDLLNTSNYNYDVIPESLDKGPFKVLFNFHLKTMGPVMEDGEIYFMDMYFRQIWTDRRLRFPEDMFKPDLRISAKVLKRIWRPDTIFYNGVGSKLHMITEPNRLFRVGSDGRILYSSRLTIKATCKMNFKLYPIDTQICPLYIGSLSHKPSELEFEWDNHKLMTKDNFTLAQFTFSKFITDTVNRTVKGELRPMLRVRFIVTRHLGFYMLQIYLPCYFIVVISWISFWINREASAARVTLGLTTMLTMTTIALNSREGIPKISYCTAMDIFLFASYFFVFATIVEYAGVNYFTKTGTFDIIESSDSSDVEGPIRSTSQRKPCFKDFLDCLIGHENKRIYKGHRESNMFNSESQIDLASRWIFPTVFILFNIFYWITLWLSSKSHGFAV